jgi:hypothetical protein
MDDQQQYKSSEKILEEKFKERRLEFTDSQLDRLLYRIATNAIEKVNEKANYKFEINGYSAVINLNISKDPYGDLSCDYNIRIRIYNLYKENDVIKCYSDSDLSPDKLQCTHKSSNSSFELFDPTQSSSIREGIKYLILSRLNIDDPGVLTDLVSNIYKQDVHVTITVSRYGNDEPDIKMNRLPYKSKP